MYTHTRSRAGEAVASQFFGAAFAVRRGRQIAPCIITGSVLRTAASVPLEALTWFRPLLVCGLDGAVYVL